MMRQFRVLGPRDAADLASLHSRCFAAPWPEKSFANLLNIPTHLGLGLLTEDASSLIGFAIYQHVMDEADLLTLAIAPDNRRRGYAQILIKAAETHLAARGCLRITLDVAADNTAAIALYKKSGFKVDGRRAGYYAREHSARVDAVLMSRDMSRHTP